MFSDFRGSSNTETAQKTGKPAKESNAEIETSQRLIFSLKHLLKQTFL